MSGGDYGFKVPVSGQKIPHGWFAALVRFVNSLILRGDGRWTQVSRDESGTSITLTAAAIEALTRPAGGTPGGSGGLIGFNLRSPAAGSAAILELVSGGTSSVTLSGANGVTVTGGTDGTILITGSTGGSSASLGFPDYTHVVWRIDSDYPFPTFPASLQYAYPVWLIGSAFSSGNSAHAQEILLTLYPGSSSQQSFDLFYRTDYEDPPPDFRFQQGVCRPIPANVPFTLTIPEDSVAPEGYDLKIFSCLS